MAKTLMATTDTFNSSPLLTYELRGAETIYLPISANALRLQQANQAINFYGRFSPGQILSSNAYALILLMINSSKWTLGNADAIFASVFLLIAAAALAVACMYRFRAESVLAGHAYSIAVFVGFLKFSDLSTTHVCLIGLILLPLMIYGSVRTYKKWSEIRYVDITPEALRRMREVDQLFRGRNAAKISFRFASKRQWFRGSLNHMCRYGDLMVSQGGSRSTVFVPADRVQIVNRVADDFRAWSFHADLDWAGDIEPIAIDNNSLSSFDCEVAAVLPVT